MVTLDLKLCGVKTTGTLPHKRTVVDSTGKLDIKHVTANDSGIYQCKASNLLGSAQKTAKLEVNLPSTTNFEQ